MASYTLKIVHNFSAARALRDYEGKCQNTHGHNFKVVVDIKTPEVERGYALDFYEVKIYLAEITGNLDHQFLNEMEPFTKLNPTTENIAKWICQKLQPCLKDQACTITTVTVWESEEFASVYHP
jgi:6-pyruvoyltetrahydropterin/6-carboxytetrahydropterin synthase